MAYQYGFCYGIVKGKMPKSASIFTADSYESAIRKVKSWAKSNYTTNKKECTLFYHGVAFGWAFMLDGKIIYLDRWELEGIGLLPKKKV